LLKKKRECDAKEIILSKQIRILEWQMQPEYARMRKAKLQEMIKKLEK